MTIPARLLSSIAFVVSILVTNACAEDSILRNVVPLSPCAPSPDEWFGYSVAIHGDTLVADARFATVPESAGPCVFVRRGRRWEFQAKLPVTRMDPGSLAVHGDTVAVGTVGAGVPGTVHVFARSGEEWTLQDVLTLPGSEEFDAFGTSLDLDGDTLVVGAPRADGEITDAGSIEIFERSAGVWTHRQTIAPVNDPWSQLFGRRVRVSGDTLIAGEGYYPDHTVLVYVRESGVWALQTELVATAGSASDEFGATFDVSGDTAIVSAPSATPRVVHVYNRSGGVWTADVPLQSPSPEPDDRFGGSVAIDGSLIVVGDPFDDDQPGQETGGSASVFVRSADGSWEHESLLLASSPARNDHFGAPVAVSGNTVVVGHPYYDSVDALNPGRVWAFEFLRGPTSFHTITPCRLVDTRQTVAIMSSNVRIVPAGGRCGVPHSARSIAANVTVVAPQAAGHLTMYHGNGTPPPTSTINFPAATTRANFAVLPLATDGTGTVAARPVLAGGGASVHVIVDVSGYFE